MTCLCLLPLSAFARDAFDYTSFEHIPVQHEGRVKPIDTLARTYLRNFSEHESLNGVSADQWLAETLFDPARALSRPCFRVFRGDVAGLPQRSDHLYSFSDLTQALKSRNGVLEQLAKTDPKTWTDDQKELVRIQENLILYTQLLRSFSLILPLSIEPPAILTREWGLKPGATFGSLQEFRKYDRRLKERLQGIIHRKGDNPDRYSEDEKNITTFAYEMQSLGEGGDLNVLLRVIPPAPGSTSDEWSSPWTLVDQGTGSPGSAALLAKWRKAAQGWQTGDAKTFEEATAALAGTPSFKSRLEIAYNHDHPLIWAMILYFAALLAFAGYKIRGIRSFYTLSILSVFAGWMLHGLAVAGRILILERPPVGTLYESLLFVSVMCVGIALLMELRRKDGTGLLIGSLIGLLLLFVSQAFATDDTMKMLVAVLNTNFWLGTHVLCITTGYGLCLITGCLAHLYLLRKAIRKDTGNLLSSVRLLGLLALLFTAVGTILGGIWADQSWGRFWGWDPKENGALLIVLWLIWVYHGQLSGHLKPLPFVAALATVNIVVALTWFGVNLLNVGLHSYGFITGVAAGLAAFCTGEILVIGFLWHTARKTA